MKNSPEDLIAKIANKMILLVLMILGLLIYIIYDSFSKSGIEKQNVKTETPAPTSPIRDIEASPNTSSAPPEETFLKPDTSKIPKTKEGTMIRYGRELIANTAKYIGPQGSVAHLTNGMNCQNCHLEAGTKPFGNNYLSVHSTYPKYRDRSGRIETEAKRVSDCIERSLNGIAVAPESKEMLAILAYLHWVGRGVSIGEKANGSGLKDLAYLDRAADVQKGEFVYAAKCQSCHQHNGQGQKPGGDSAGWRYPPLWGNNSYNIGAGLYRISNFAKYVKCNMPFGATYSKPQLTDEEAWDVAAYVNSQPRPTKDLSKDFPDISKKPVDYPFGPYTDAFTEQQHKFGPFKVIEEKKNGK
jgi:thiosulfate dehydrogenase